MVYGFELKTIQVFIRRVSSSLSFWIASFPISLVGFFAGIAVTSVYGVAQLDAKHKNVNGEVLAALEDLRVSARRVCLSLRC